MSQWQVLPQVDAEAAARFASLDAVFALEGEIVARDSLSHTLRVAVGGRRYYVKRYHGLGKKPLRTLLATPRVALEWINLQRFAAWGIPTAQVVACGLERQGGRFRRGALITAEIPDATDLARLARAGDPRLKSQSWWHGVSTRIADITQRMHQHRFAHGDLKWRNLLVDADGQVFLIDCPSGGFWRAPFLEYRIVKDLACLDKVARRTLSRTQRLRFYLGYARQPRLDPAAKRRIRRILRFFRGRDADHETAASLRAAGRQVPARCVLRLEDGSPLGIRRWLRILPGKRLTGVAEWQGRDVLAKLFIAERGAARHGQRELDGLTRLAQLNLQTPALLARGRLLKGGHFILTEFLPQARTPAPDALADLLPVFEQVGRLHARGLVQADIHLDNFLLDGPTLHCIDGDAIRAAASDAQRLDNLALLLAQLAPATRHAGQDALLAAYRRGNPGWAIDAALLDAAIVRAREARLADYLGKCLRDCSLFRVTHRIDLFKARLREEADFLAPLLSDPDAWITHGVALKRGRSATLAQIELEGRPLVVKRYNIKNAGHAVSRAWRPSRAWHSWIAAHRLRFLGIATPRPLALLERRLGPLRGRAWLVSEHCEGIDLQTLLTDHEDSGLPAGLKAGLQQLFSQLAEARISHGDTKANNFLWDGTQVQVLDLDAMQRHGTEAAFNRAWQRDRARFLRNWPPGSRLWRELDAALPPA